MQYLMNKFQLSKVPMVGASGGGFAAVLSTCEVHPEQVLETAYALSLKHNIWERPLGLMGTWGGLVEQWLHDLLPADAAERCRDQVGIVVTQLPFCNQLAISDFKDKTDLINVAMASAHVPMFLVSFTTASGSTPKPVRKAVELATGKRGCACCWKLSSGWVGKEQQQQLGAHIHALSNCVNNPHYKLPAGLAADAAAACLYIWGGTWCMLPPGYMLSLSGVVQGSLSPLSSFCADYMLLSECAAGLESQQGLSRSPVCGWKLPRFLLWCQL